MATAPHQESNPLPLEAIATINQAIDAMLADLELSPLSQRTYRHGLQALIRYLHIAREDDAAARATSSARSTPRLPP